MGRFQVLPPLASPNCCQNRGRGGGVFGVLAEIVGFPLGLFNPQAYQKDTHFGVVFF